MKKILLFMVLSLMIGLGLLSAQNSECSILIVPGFDSECVITGYPIDKPEEGSPFFGLDLPEGCFKACRGNTVEYFAVADSATGYRWAVFNGTISGVTNEQSVSVVWGNDYFGTVEVSGYLRKH